MFEDQKKLKQQLVEFGFRQTQVAYHLRMDPGRLSNMLAGHIQMPYEVREKIKNMITKKARKLVKEAGKFLNEPPHKPLKRISK